jgi:predicted dehydrogenase
MTSVRLAQIGCGYWGQNLLRNFWEAEEIELAAACDLSPDLLARTKKRYPGVTLTQSYAEVLADPRIDAVVLATPVSTHHKFARQALEYGKHVLVEKPLCATSADALDLIELAERQDRTLMVDHTFLYTGAVRRMKQLIDVGEIGELLYYDSVRINLGLIQSDTNVLWDLGPHDFSIMDYLCGSDPVAVAATGVGHFDSPFEDVGYVTVRFPSNLIAHFHLNWLAPVKVRMTLIGGSRKMIVYNDMEASEKVKVYDRGVTVNHDPERRSRMLAGYRNGDMVAPQLDTNEALRLVAREFAQAILQRRPPLTDGYAGYRVVRLLEAAQKSIELNGQEVPLTSLARPRLACAVAQAGQPKIRE